LLLARVWGLEAGKGSLKWPAAEAPLKSDLSGKRFNLASRFRIKKAAKSWRGKITKIPHDFAPHDFAKSCIVTFAVSPQAHRQ
jgi:hypothetical protein